MHGQGRRIPAASSAGFTGQASFGFTFSCEKGDLKIELSYNDKGSKPDSARRSGFMGSSTASTQCWSPQICIGENPPPPPENQLIFLGRYCLTSSAPSGFPSTCPKQRDVDHAAVPLRGHRAGQRPELTPSPGDFFSIKLSTATCAMPRPDLSCSQLPVLSRVLHSGGLPGGWKHHRQVTLANASLTSGTRVMDSDDRAARPGWYHRHFRAASSSPGRPAVSAGAVVGGQLPTVAHAAEGGSGLHGVELRGMYLTSKNRLAEGRFGTMFKQLPAFAPPDELLTNLAKTMVEPDSSRRQPRQHRPTTVRRVHVHRAVHRPRHHVRHHAAQSAAGGPRCDRQLPDGALRPRLGLRTRAGE